MQEKAPEVHILKSMQPQSMKSQDVEDRLVSPVIDERVEMYNGYEELMWQQFLEAEADSVEEEYMASELAKVYLLNTSQKLSSPDPTRRSPNRDLWAERYTNSSTELYEAPAVPFVQQIAAIELAELSGKSGEYVDEVNAFYQMLSERTHEVEAIDRESLLQLGQEQVGRLSEAFREVNNGWFNYLEENRKDVYSAAELRDMFSELVSIGLQNDSGWEDWVVVLAEGENQVRTVATDKEIMVGADRAQVSHDEAVCLVAHELGVHAQRAVNGEKIDHSLLKGFWGNADIEESFGIFSERLMSGKTPAKARDRYVDIALALGVVPGEQLTRPELIELATKRALARKEIRGEAVTQDTIDSETGKAETHVNRIFRGGDGRTGKTPAVLTKDVIYYPAQFEDYLARELELGKEPSEVLQFLLQGKFDPTNPNHVAHLERLKQQPIE